jgi:hypothetical protein
MVLGVADAAPGVADAVPGLAAAGSCRKGGTTRSAARAPLAANTTPASSLGGVAIAVMGAYHGL